MGRGIIEPVDVMDNEPWSQDLLDWMALNFVESKCDIKELIYLIATSNTYQLPSVSFKDPNKIIAQDYIFKGRLRKRMSAEQFADAVSYIIEPLFLELTKGERLHDALKKGAENWKKKYHTGNIIIKELYSKALNRAPNQKEFEVAKKHWATIRKLMLWAIVLLPEFQIIY
jgi:hypothetical protein